MSEFSARNEDEDEVVEVSAEGSIAAPSVPAFDTSETEIKDIKLASAYKEEGNELYRNQDYDGSIGTHSLAHSPTYSLTYSPTHSPTHSPTEKYSFAILHCPNDDVENKAVFLGNRAAAYHSIEEYRQVVDDCTAALELKPDYIKVLYRRSQVPSPSPTHSLTYSLTYLIYNFLCNPLVTFLLLGRRKT